MALAEENMDIWGQGARGGLGDWAGRLQGFTGHCKDFGLLSDWNVTASICIENDIILVAVSGKIGLKPTITAINNGIDIRAAGLVYSYLTKTPQICGYWKKTSLCTYCSAQN